MVLSNFLMNTWYFPNRKCLEIEKRLKNEDEEIFKIEKILERTIKNRKQYIMDSQIGIERYVFNIEIDMEKNLKHFRR